MSKIKDTIEEEKDFSNKEIEAIEHEQGYFFDEENHIHELDGKPLIGTSSMSSVLYKPLTWWASGLAVGKLGWVHKGDKTKGFLKKEERINAVREKLDEIKLMNAAQFLDLLDEAYAAHSKKLDRSAQEGTDMHAVMEAYIKHCIKNNDSQPDKDYQSEYVNISEENKNKLKILIDWSVSTVKRFLWSEAHCYSRKYWLGGITDCGYEDINGKYAVLDFKSSKDVYISQFWQCVGYALQLEENGGFDKNGVKLFELDRPIDYVSVLAFGMKNPEVLSNYDMAGGKEAVESMITLYKKLNIK